MIFEQFIKEYLAKGLIKKQRPDSKAAEHLVLRARKDVTTAEANLDIDEGIAYTVAYLAMLRAGRAIMLIKGCRPADGYQHKTVVEFMSFQLGKEFGHIVDRFDIMRRKRNIFTYDVAISISKTEAKSAIHTADEFVKLIERVIKEEFPQIKFKF
jgi:uncharacterized protein (UPF0332 family)